MTEARKKLLIVEDDDGLRRQLRWAFDSHQIFLASEREGAMDLVSRERPPVVILDVGLPPDPDGPSEGLALLDEIISLASETKVIVMTGQSDRAHAVQAVAKGAYDFYQKPIEIEVLTLIVDRAYGLWKLEDEVRRVNAAPTSPDIPSFITANPEMLRLLGVVRKVAGSEVRPLIIGESGPGKELVASSIHRLSRRAEKAFVAINCAAIPEQLLESELFGHERGAFTGAVKTTIGKVEVADGGSLFLDEIGDLRPGLQGKLLRFLQENVIERIGGRRQIRVDVRVISATNQDLADLVKAGDFREDLFYRLSEFKVEIPPLRERPEDAIVIANHYLRELAQEHNHFVRGFSGDALAAISSHAWPGNVRELQNRIKRAVVVASCPRLSAQDLELSPPDDYYKPKPKSLSLKEARDRAERQAVEDAMRLTGGNVSKAARILRVSRPKLYDLLHYHGMKA